MAALNAMFMDPHLVRRSQRVILALPVTVYVDHEQGNSAGEVAKTTVVNSCGAMISLAKQVSNGQKLRLVNNVTREEIRCTVANVRRSDHDKQKWDVGIAFEVAKPRYWGIAFPPDDWDPANRKRAAAPRKD